MASENVEIVRRFVEALDRTDYEDAIACLDQDAEWHNTGSFPGPRTVTGSEAIIEFWRMLVESFDPEEGGTAIEGLKASGDRVVAGLRSRGVGAGSEIPVEARYALTVSLRAGRIQRVDVSGDYAGALEALGLRE